MCTIYSKLSKLVAQTRADLSTQKVTSRFAWEGGINNGIPPVIAASLASHEQ